MNTKSQLSVDTVVVQGGLVADQSGAPAPAVPPISPSVGHVHPDLADADRALGYAGGAVPVAPRSFVYSRHGGPNQAAFEETIATLEGAQGAVSFSSGMAALHAALLAAVPPGGSVVSAEQLYGVTRTLLDHLTTAMRLRVSYADFLDIAAVRRAVEEMKPSCVLCETLTNPLARIVEIGEVGDIAHRAGSLLLVDNTFATPVLLRPLGAGADMVVHSTTKYINGHGDVLGGVVAGSREAMERVYQHRRVLGGRSPRPSTPG
jgi:cystathionine gamma-synthase